MARTKGIYKRGKVYWVMYKGLDGAIRRESSRSYRYRDAEALLAQRRQAVLAGNEPEVKRVRNHKFNELVEEYSRWASKQRSYSSKVYFIRDLSAAFGNLPLRRFSTMLVEQYQSEKLQSGRKPATVNRYLATLKHMFSKAVDWEMVEEGTLKRVRKVKLLPENNRRLRYLSPEECRELLAACDRHLRPIVETALNTGMRKGEILSLRWDENIDLRHGFILLTDTKNGERREIPINDTLRVLMAGLVRRVDIPFVFYDQASGCRYQDVKRSFGSACRRAGIKDFRFHDLRHTFASQLVMAGVDLLTVKELLGHKDLKMTLRYAHLAPGHKADAVNALARALA